MKKLMTLVLGMTFAIGATALLAQIPAAAPAPAPAKKADTVKPAKKTVAKKTVAKKTTDTAKPAPKAKKPAKKTDATK